jgi:anaphase-promoting complex subunit 3
LTSLLRVLGHGYRQLCQFFCKEAIKIFCRLPRRHYESGWTQQQLGRAYFEMTKYSDAEKYFKKMMNLEPWRLEGLDIYSTCLWQMRKQVDLTYLSHQMLEKSLYTPETWVVVGNCYSIQKEHEIAIKYFERAIQLNPTYAYAYTL